MRRYVIIICFFALLALFCMTGCNCTCDGETYRVSLPYNMCYETCSNCNTCYNFTRQSRDTAVEGVDYEVTATINGDRFTFDMVVYNEINIEHIEYCVIQDGRVLLQFSPGRIDSTKERLHYEFLIPDIDPNGGEIYYIQNMFAVNKSVSYDCVGEWYVDSCNCFSNCVNCD